MKTCITITQDEANTLLDQLSDIPIPLKWAGIVHHVQRWLAQKFQEGEDATQNGSMPRPEGLPVLTDAQ